MDTGRYERVPDVDLVQLLADIEIYERVPNVEIATERDQTYEQVPNLNF